MTKEEMVDAARGLGIDLVGVTRTAEVPGRHPLLQETSRSTLPTFIVLAKKIHGGTMGALDPIYRQVGAGRVMTRLEEASGNLAYALERAGHFALMVPSLVLDFKRENTGENTPAGQGARFLREAAVRAGLGTLGLNTMLLTPEFGPRVFLGGVMTDAELEPDRPRVEALCPGLEACGRCAAVCPEEAIPLAAPEAATADDVRGLDAMACARSSQPFGVERFVEFLQALFRAGSKEKATALLRSPATLEIWQDLGISRHAAFTGCLACWQVCPVGADYERFAASPHRREELPDGVRHVRDGAGVRIDNRTTRAPRRPGVGEH